MKTDPNLNRKRRAFLQWILLQLFFWIATAISIFVLLVEGSKWKTEFMGKDTGTPQDKKKYYDEIAVMFTQLLSKQAAC